MQDLQRRLIALSYNPGQADGMSGPKTERARPWARLLEKEPKRSAVAGAVAVISRQPKASRSITEIIVHCTATPEGRDVSVDTIRSWHLANGWKDIGYHYVVMLDGSIEAGRPEAQVGSHVAGHNTGTFGIAYVGGVAADGKTAKDTRTPAQRAALLDLARALIGKYPTVRKVTGHNQYAAKACPSFDVRKDDIGRLV